MEFLQTAGLYLLARLNEKTTWVGIIGWVVTEVGLKLNLDFSTALVQVGVSLAGMALVLVNEGWFAKGKTS
ncbi:MAG: hypothetical protein ACLQIQ_08495 [Beijerinckiaceae bacterium]